MTARAKWKMDAIHAFAREGELEKLVNCIESGVNANVNDSGGRTALHWAVDRGHFNVVELLVCNGADVDAKDNEGQTALHYAKFLIKHKTSTDIKDNDGSSPLDLCEANGPE